MDNIAATVAELLVKIGADGSGLRKEIAASQRQLKRGFGPEALGVSQGAVTLMGGLAASMALVGGAAIKMAADMEQNKIAFETMLGSAQRADSFLRELESFAAKTPFEFTGLVNSSKKLMAYGFAAQEIIPIMTQIGNAVAALGGSTEVLDRVTLAFGQMKAKGMVSGEEMRQLAEAGIPAWQMLAKVIGKDIPTTMKLAEEKALNADAAIAGMLSQMGEKYSGMMQKQSGTITGILSNLKDQSSNLMRALGDQIVDALDLKTRMQSGLKFLEEFTAKVRNSGLTEAFRDMIPGTVQASLYALAGSLTAVVIPAMYAMVTAVTIAGVALWKFIAIGAAIGLAVGFVSRMVDVFYELADASSEASDRLRVQSMYMSDIQVQADAAAVSVDRLRRATLNLGAAVGSPEEYFAGTGYKSVAPATPPGPVITGGEGKSGKDPVKEAERVSEAIEREWAQTTKTNLEQLDKWRDDHLEGLEKVADANENHERDKERVAATYAERRRKILLQEAADALATFRSIRDGYGSIQREITTGGLTGESKDIAAIRQGYADKAKASADYFSKLTMDYATSTEAQKQIILAALDSQGVAYRVSAEGRLTFDKAMADASAAYQKQMMDDLTAYYRTNKDIQAEIDAAYQTMNTQRLINALTEENAIRMNDYEAQKSMMETYQEIFLAAHATTSQLMADMYKGAFSGLSTAISGVLTGTKTLGQAFADLGKSMLKIVADYVAKWLAGRLMMAVFGKSMLAGDTAASTLAAAKTAAAWSKAAAMVSLATFGANSLPAMAGIGATVAFSVGLSSVPGLASGGITTGATLAEIGEGHYQEAVMPLNRKLFEKMGLAQPKSAEDSGQNPITLIIQGGVNDADGIRRLIMDEGAAIVRSVSKQVKQFNAAEVGI